ncbi:MAG: MBL fold metallo-hydrolase [Negativicutes bacterium]|nr:MBL fold metallo-hydrolase [Negativicutes bacterium]
MNIKRFRVGSLASNAYLVSNQQRQAFLVDAGGGAQEILAEISANRLSLLYLINTHGHYDHIADDAVIVAATGARLLIHQQDLPALQDAKLNLAGLLASQFTPVPNGEALMGGERIPFGETEIQVLHTPGHTPGGICLLLGEDVFSGDTLFAGSIGRSDLSGGDRAALMASLQYLLRLLPDQVVVHPGHNRETTIGEEKATNPWLKMAMSVK